MRIIAPPDLSAARVNAGSNRDPVDAARRRGLIDLMLFGVVLGAGLGCFAQDGHPVSAPTSATPTTETKAIPAADKALEVQKLEAAEARKKQISDEGDQLLAMALSLKAEVDKTNKDTLSLKVIRKADEIERLAKTVKEKPKQGSGTG